MIEVTFGDTIPVADANGKSTGRAPREVGLTVSDDFGCGERLDYIIQLDIKNEEATSQMSIDVA